MADLFRSKTQKTIPTLLKMEFEGGSRTETSF